MRGGEADGDDSADTLIGVSFPDRFRASEYLTAMARLASRGDIALKDAVIVVKHTDGSTRVEETVDPSPGRAALSGAVWAGLVGLLVGGPVGWLAGGAVGAGVGAVTARAVDLGIPDEWVAWFRAAVRPDTVTVVVLTPHLQIESFVAEAGRFAGATLVYANLAPGVVDRLHAAFGGSTG